MRHEHDLPREVQSAMRARVGTLERLDPLGGLSGRTVLAAHGRLGTVVVKGPATSAEVAVAADLNPHLVAAGVRTARATVISTADAGKWLLLEHFPQELPRERWGADHDVLTVLRALHSLPKALVDGVDGRYLPRWDPSLTAAAVAALRGPSTFADRLSELADRCQYLFQPSVVVSADPNPLNWRIDTAGRPVLLDWERVTLAHPAVDLGILMPGLGDPVTASRIADLYQGASVTGADVLRAKAWSIVEFAGTAPPGSEAAALIQQVRDDAVQVLASAPI